MDLEHPDITHTLRTGYPNKKVPTAMDTNKNTQLDYIKKSEESQMGIKDLTLSDVLKQKGAKISINFFFADGIVEAYKNIKPYKELGDITRKSTNGTNWLVIETDDIEVTSFYDKGDHVK